MIYFTPSPTHSPSPSPSPEHYREIVSVPERDNLLGRWSVCPSVKCPRVTLCTSVECRGGGGRGTICTSVECQGGDIIMGTFYTMTLV